MKSSGRSGGEESWVNSGLGIRKNKYGEWRIGNLEVRYGDIIEFGSYEKPYDTNIQWLYWNGDKYEKADANDINIDCIIAKIDIPLALPPKERWRINATPDQIKLVESSRENGRVWFFNIFMM